MRHLYLCFLGVQFRADSKRRNDIPLSGRGRARLGFATRPSIGRPGGDKEIEVTAGRVPKAGGEYTFHRYELPDDHPSPRDGELRDFLTLGTDDTLRLA
jgi:hypothetical protein